MKTAWNDRIWPLMEEAFPPAERRTREGQRNILSRREVCLRVLTEGDRVTGFVTWWELPSCRFLEHLAVENGLRGGGRGRRLLRLALEKADRPVVLEIEPPEESAQALRRLHFYRENGFLINDFPYLQQPLKPGDRPVPLRIMSWKSGLT